MNKKTVMTILITALASSILTVAGFCILFNLDGKNLLNFSRLLGAMTFIESHYVQEVDRNNLIDGAISGMVRSLGDPHSIYLDSKLYNRLKSETTGSFGGIGVYMGFKDGGVQVLSVMPDSPGEKVGLMAGDSILAVNSQPISEIEPGEVALKIRGEVGSDVELLIHREGEEDKTYKITREVIKVDTVFGKMLDDKLGYIRITNFSENTGKEFKEAYAQLEEQGMKGLIIDLRENPGGLVTSCVEIANMVVPQGKIVSVVQRDGTREDHMSQLPQAKYPLVVLIDGNSASASEILAGALQDTQAAVLVGTKSYGKGSVQAVIPLPFGEALKLTIAKYYTPNGRSIDGTGIEPDEVVEQPAESTTDFQLAKAIEVMKNKLK